MATAMTAETISVGVRRRFRLGRPGRGAAMADSVHVEVPRIPDRDLLLAALEERGISGTPVDEDDGRLAVEIPCEGDSADLCADLVAELESWLAEAGLPFVPVPLDGRVLLRPPGS
jgi:hypothetical protein